MGEFQRPIQSSKVTYKPVLNIFQFSQKKKKTKKQNQDYFCNKHTPTTVFIDGSLTCNFKSPSTDKNG